MNELTIEALCDQGRLSGSIRYHNGCQPAARPEDTVMPHWVLSLWLARKASDGTIPRFAGEIQLPPAANAAETHYGEAVGVGTIGRVLNAEPVSVGCGEWEEAAATFCCRRNAINYVRRGGDLWIRRIGHEPERLTGVRIVTAEDSE